MTGTVSNLFPPCRQIENQSESEKTTADTRHLLYNLPMKQGDPVKAFLWQQKQKIPGSFG